MTEQASLQATAARGWRAYKPGGPYALRGACDYPWISPLWADPTPPTFSGRDGVHLADSRDEAARYGPVLAEAVGWGVCIRHQSGWRVQCCRVERLYVPRPLVELLPGWTREVEVVETNSGLAKTSLIKADLRRADLRWADLHWTDLRRADLREADLTSANLYWADLEGADLSGADLTGADLRGANLRYANLAGADLTGANLDGARLPEEVPAWRV